MSTGWETTVNTGNPNADRETIQSWQSQVQAQGLVMQVTPSPTGGFHVKAVPAAEANAYGAPPPAAPQAYGQPQPMQQPQPMGYGAPQPQAQPQPQAGGAWGQPQQQQQAPQQSAGAFGGAFGGAAAMMGGAAQNAQQAWGANAPNAGLAPAGGLGAQRVAYLRKVYGLLGASTLFAVVAGYIATSPLLGTTTLETTRGAIEVPTAVALLGGNRVTLLIAWAVLVGSTFVASWVSKIRIVNVIALFFCAGLMGFELSPMVWVASYLGDLGMTASASPVRDAGIMTLGIFGGLTGYVFVTKKDFSYMKGFLSMASMALMVACLLTFVFQAEMFSLAVAGVGALITIAMLLYVTSYIFRNSDMDDPVGDALALLVQLRNLFMFLLRLFMSRRD